MCVRWQRRKQVTTIRQECIRTIRRTKKERERSQLDPVMERREQSDRGETLPGAAPVEFHRRWRQRKSVTATERKTEDGEEKGRGGKEKHMERHTNTETHIDRDGQRQTQDKREGGLVETRKKIIYMRDRQRRKDSRMGIPD